jgi:hypothetical protein
VERGFLRLQIRDKFLYSVNRNLIQDRPLYVAVPLNRLVDLVTLLTHCARPFQASVNRITCHFNTTVALFCFNDLETFKYYAALFRSRGCSSPVEFACTIHGRARPVLHLDPMRRSAGTITARRGLSSIKSA